MLEERIRQLFEQVMRDMDSMGVPYNKNIISFKINGRAKARFGCCKRVGAAGKRDGFKIEISKFACDADEKEIKDILAHELLHTVEGCYDHGQKWKYLAKQLKPLGYDVTARTSYEKVGVDDPRSEKAYNYIIQCQKCGQVIYRQRKCNLTEKTKYYRCARCGGKLKSQRINWDK